MSVTASGTTTEVYFSSTWQHIEEDVGFAAKRQQVYSPFYVDDMIERDRDSDTTGITS